MSANGSPAENGTAEVPRQRRLGLNEDWVATIVGLLLLVLVLTGVIPTGLVP
ncbi:MAG: hypothetical protein ACRDRP_23445 [Pseudonocardiaceae bacterium]